MELYSGSETILGGSGGMLPQKIFKTRIFNLAENEFQTTKFPDFWNSVANSLTFPGFLGQWQPWYFRPYHHQFEKLPVKKLKSDLHSRVSTVASEIFNTGMCKLVNSIKLPKGFFLSARILSSNISTSTKVSCSEINQTFPTSPVDVSSHH